MESGMIGIRVVRACFAALHLVLLLPYVGTAEEACPRYLSSDGRAGVRVYVPGSWAMLGVDVANPTDRPVEILSSAYFGGQPELQYARPLWIPARARLAAWQPVLVPRGVPRGRGRGDASRLSWVA